MSNTSERLRQLSERVTYLERALASTVGKACPGCGAMMEHLHSMAWLERVRYGDSYRVYEREVDKPKNWYCFTCGMAVSDDDVVIKGFGVHRGP